MEQKTQKREGGRKAFTLIELLIVIAIILILISIALPNFLEAQMRAKITNARGELRSFSQAAEVYQTDYSRYPRQAFYEPTQFRPIDRGPNRHSIMQLTTPVQYLQEVSPDPFALAGEPVPDMYGHPWREFHWDPQNQHTYFYYSYESMKTEGVGEEWRRNAGAWYSYTSLGPDGDFDNCPVDSFRNSVDTVGNDKGCWNRTCYAPTNGTKSSGDLIQTNTYLDR